MDENNINENVNETVETNESVETEAQGTTEPQVEETPEPQVQSVPEPTPEPQVQQGYNQAEYNQTAQTTKQSNPDGKATASMVCGIISVIPCCWGIVTLVLGIIAVVMANQYTQMTGDTENSKAKAGKICGIIGIVGSAIGTIYALVLLANGGLSNLNF